MNKRSGLGIAATVLAALALGASAFNQDTPPPPPQLAQFADAPPCAEEAELLLAPITLRASPAPDAAALITLPAGALVYRCGGSEIWRRMMFVPAGEAADCSMRAPDAQCPVGWTKDEVRTGIVG